MLIFLRVWRSLLHLSRQPWKLVFSFLLGAALPCVLPVTFTLEPLTTGALLLLFGLLALCLALGGPHAPVYLPISAFLECDRPGFCLLPWFSAGSSGAPRGSLRC